MSAVTQLQQREKLGNDLIYAYTVGRIGQEMGIPAALGLPEQAAQTFDKIFGDPTLVGVPTSQGWESGKLKLIGKLKKWWDNSAAARAKSLSTAGGAAKIVGGLGVVSALTYGGFVWLTEDDRQNARVVAQKAKHVEALINSGDPELRKKALGLVEGMGATRIPTLGWIAIIAGIGVLGLFVFRKT